MGSISGRKLNQVIDNLEYILAIELLTACQAIEFRRPLKSSELLEFAHHYVRSFVSFAEEDRVFADDINKVKSMIADFSFVEKLNEYSFSKGIVLNENFDDFKI
jgi:histidine ammonia-lyase